MTKRSMLAATYVFIIKLLERTWPRLGSARNKGNLPKFQKHGSWQRKSMLAATYSFIIKLLECTWPRLGSAKNIGNLPESQKRVSEPPLKQWKKRDLPHFGLFSQNRPKWGKKSFFRWFRGGVRKPGWKPIFSKHISKRCSARLPLATIVALLVGPLFYLIDWYWLTR